MTTKDDENIIDCSSNEPRNDDQDQHRGHSDSNTVKKTPKIDLNRSDLLKLLSCLEGELQARDVVIATLKCEKIKSMLKNRSSSSAGDCLLIKDPLAALQRDCFATFDPTNNGDDSLSYQQLGSLENLVLQQRRTHLRIANVLKDNQVMHRKILELERLKKQQLEYELKKLQHTLEDERIKHKQIVFFLLAERKKIVMKYIEERKRSEDLGQILGEEKSKVDSMAEGLEEESKKSLEMEAELEKNLALFESESKKLMAALSAEEERSKTLELELTKCRSEIVSLEKRLSEALRDNNLPELSSRSSSVSSGRVMSAPSDPIMSSVAKVVQPTATASSVRVSGPMTGIARSVNPGVFYHKGTTGPINEFQVENNNSSPIATNSIGSSPGGGTIKKQPIAFARNAQSVDIVGPSNTALQKPPPPFLGGIQRNMSVPSPSSMFAESPGGGGKKPLVPPQTSLGRGTPPPVPPNKPIIPPKKDLGGIIKKQQQQQSVDNNVAAINNKSPRESVAPKPDSVATDNADAVENQREGGAVNN